MLTFFLVFSLFTYIFFNKYYKEVREMRKIFFRIHGELILILMLGAFLGFNVSAFAQVAEIAFSAPWGDNEGDIGIINVPEMERCGPLSFCAESSRIFLLDSVHQQLVGVGTGGKSTFAIKGVAGWSLCGDGSGGAFVQTADRIVHIDPKGDKRGMFKINADAGKPAKLIEGYGNELFVDHQGQVSLRSVNQKIHKIAGAKGPKRLESSVPGVSLDFQIKRMLKNEVRIIGFDDQGKDLVSVTLEIDGGTAGAVLYKGMDDQGNLYVEVENIRQGKAFLEVHRYSQTGKRLTVFELSNDYFTTVYKKTEVAPDGSIFQMLTTKDGVRVLRYGKEG